MSVTGCCTEVIFEGMEGMKLRREKQLARKNKEEEGARNEDRLWHKAG